MIVSAQDPTIDLEQYCMMLTRSTSFQTAFGKGQIFEGWTPLGRPQVYNLQLKTKSTRAVNKCDSSILPTHPTLNPKP